MDETNIKTVDGKEVIEITRSVVTSLTKAQVTNQLDLISKQELELAKRKATFLQHLNKFSNE